MIVKGLQARGCDVTMTLGGEGPWQERISRDCPVSVIEHKNWLRQQHPLRFLRDLAAEQKKAQAFEESFARTKPDLVYLNSLVCYAPAVAAHRLRIPVVWHLRELFSDVGGEMVWPRWIPKALIRRRIGALADQIVVNSQAVADNVFGLMNGISSIRIPNGVSDNFFDHVDDKESARKHFGLPPDAPVVGVPATFRPMKGHEFFFRSVPAILARVPDCWFALSGPLDSPFALKLKESIQNESFVDRMIFPGLVQDMPRFYRACDVCCVPSSSEPFGRTAIECMAMQVPLVASAVGGLKEIVEHDRNGLLVESHDQVALSQAIVSLLTKPQRKQRLVAQAAKDARENYSAEVYSGRVIEVINEVLRPYSKSL